MDGDAFLFMIVSWALILTLNIFCFTLLLTRGQSGEVETPRGIDKLQDEEREEIT